MSPRRGYVAVTIADEQPPAVATDHAQRDTGQPSMAYLDEISGLGVSRLESSRAAAAVAVAVRDLPSRQESPKTGHWQQ